MTIWAPHYLHVFTVYRQNCSDPWNYRAKPIYTRRTWQPIAIVHTRGKQWRHKNKERDYFLSFANLALLVWDYKAQLFIKPAASLRPPKATRKMCSFFLFKSSVHVSHLRLLQMLASTYSTPSLPQRPARLNHPVQTSNLQRLASQP